MKTIKVTSLLVSILIPLSLYPWSFFGKKSTEPCPACPSQQAPLKNTTSPKIEAKKALKSSTIDLVKTSFEGELKVFEVEQVVRIGIPRDDVATTMDGNSVHPFLGLTTLISFQPGSKAGVELMGMGDIVMLEKEAQEAINVALKQGMSISALHNHLIGENPRFLFMHLELEGDEASVIKAFKKVVETTKQGVLRKSIKATTNALTLEPLKAILGEPGESKEGMYKFVFGREFKAKCSCTVGKGMGVASWAAFAGTDNDATMSGDFALLETEVQAVLQALAKHGIKILAIHNHLLEEEPRYISVHFAGQGKAIELAKAFNEALNKTGTKR